MKKREILPPVTTWMDLEHIILRYIILHDIIFKWSPKKPNS